MFEEKNVVYSNPVKINDDIYEVSKQSTIRIYIASLTADKAIYEAKLNRINTILAKLNTL